MKKIFFFFFLTLLFHFGFSQDTYLQIKGEPGLSVYVPIEINITIPRIEGVTNMGKTKDQWIAEKIPAGEYPITFTFNGKSITKTVEVDEDNTTSVFINMLNGEFKSKSTLDERIAKQFKANITEGNYLYEEKDHISIRSHLNGVSVDLQLKPEDKGYYQLMIGFYNVGI
ncbi:hypothetical protein [Pseudoflavitalea rhizosphaerae]|uniref:hypothetical protein n=1 Tax=Pseudoflavitalea rhizosphaerae TaxID=1884793 RepID=UPI000F8E9678|nr:hypothetical protein [Pseudoflavitalea rhizosphaerae]